MKFLGFFCLMSILMLGCEKKDDNNSEDTRTTSIILECQNELTGVCDSSSASAQNKTGYIYYLNDNCLTIDPAQGVSLSDIISYAKVTMDCDNSGCTGTTTTWFDTNDSQIANPPSEGQLGTRAFVAYIDLGSDAQDSNGIDGLDINTDPVSGCSDLENDEPYGTHTLMSFGI